jgi:HemY protein
MRALLVMLLLAAAVAGGAFFAGHPGQVEIVWQGWQVDTSVGVLVAAAALLALVAALLALAVAAVRRVPRNLRRRRTARRRRRGERELTGGIVALAAGQVDVALLHAGRARRLLDDAPMTLLLSGEAAHRQGDAAAARQAYTTLLARRDTEFLGLRGLIGQALRDGDDATALRLGERARLLRPQAGWLAEKLLVLQARGGDWEAARELLAGAARHGALPPERARHHRGIVLHELSLAAERRGDLRLAAKLAGEAQALAPDLAAPAWQHGRLLLALGRRRAATKALKRAWRSAPHPDLARLYLDLRPEAGPLARAAAAQRLAAQNPAAAESRLAIVEAALAARLWGEAQRHLELAAGPPPAVPTRRECLLSAQLAEGSGNPRAAHDWRERAVGAPPDAGYMCRQCGSDSARWQPLCAACGSFDTLAWQAQRPAGAALPNSAVTTLLLPAAEVASSRLARTAQSDN